MSMVRMESCIMHASCVYLHNSNFSYIPVYMLHCMHVYLYTVQVIYTIFAQSDAMATIYFITRISRLLFKSSYYSRAAFILNSVVLVKFL